jgi:hypothetical protein
LKRKGGNVILDYVDDAVQVVEKGLRGENLSRYVKYGN